MTSEQVLCHYVPHKPVKLACDASPYGLDRALSHVMDDGTERPIAFASRSLAKAEKAYSQIDKEALAIYWGVVKFHTYLYGRRFKLVTDHKPLVSILNPSAGIPAMTAARLQRYALYLAGHTYNIEYRNTKSHCNADGLSRLPLSITTDYEDTATVSFTILRWRTYQLPVHKLNWELNEIRSYHMCWTVFEQDTMLYLQTMRDFVHTVTDSRN